MSWIGGELPGNDEQGTIRNYETVHHLGGTANFDLLRVSEYADLLLHNGTLKVTSKLKIDNHGVIVVESPATVDGFLVDVGFDGVLQLDGGTVAGKTVKTTDTGRIEGHGTLSPEKLLDNQGYIEAKDGILSIDMPSLSDLDLDGSNENGVVVAETGSLEIHRFLKDDFNGRMYIAEGQHVSMDYYLLMDSGSELNFKYSPNGGLAELVGSSNGISLYGNIEVLPETDARIRSDSIGLYLKDVTDDLQVWYNSSLSLEGDIKYQLGKGSIEGEGTLHQDGNAEVVLDAAINTQFFNWDGNNEAKPKDTTINDHATFTINSKTIDTNDDAYDGTVTLKNGSTLIVNSEYQGSPGWKLDPGGKIDLGPNATVGGAPLISAGNIAAHGGSSQITSDLTLLAGSTTTLDTKTTLNLKGNMVHYAGGDVDGPIAMFEEAMVQQFANARVSGHSTVEVMYFNWDPSEKDDRVTVIDHTGYFKIVAGKIGTFVDLGDDTDEGYGDQIDINSGILEVLVGADAHVDLPASWTLRQDGVMNLNLTFHSSPSVLGSHLLNKGLIQGTGQFFNPLSNDGSIVVGKEDGIGTIQLYNVFDQTEHGVLSIEQGGLGAGTEHDVVLTNSEFYLDGTLALSLLDGYTPNPGDWFRIIDGTSGGKRIGEFKVVDLPELGMWKVIYGDDYVDLRFESVPEVGVLGFAGPAFVLFVAGVVRRHRRRSAQAGPTVGSNGANNKR